MDEQQWRWCQDKNRDIGGALKKEQDKPEKKRKKEISGFEETKLARVKEQQKSYSTRACEEGDSTEVCDELRFCAKDWS